MEDIKDGVIVNDEGTKKYYINGVLHRDDGPAIEHQSGTKLWFLNGMLHREDGPALTNTNGYSAWYIKDELHREDGPAEEYINGYSFWHLRGREIHLPNEFETMEEFFEYLNQDEEYALQWINDFNGIISYIKNPTNKQIRLHAMRWKI